nr:MAG TPA: YopX protein [Caudoviricetes sp.]
MREILFRGKRKTDNEWLYGFPYITRKNAVKINWYCSEFGSMRTDEVDPETVGQFTGLTDKNDVKIFEGDIIEGHRSSQWNHELMRCVITYNRDHFEARYYPRGIHGNYFTYKIMFSKDVVVIGNIYDNPELIGGLKDD